MCGIIGYLGDREATPILMESLKRLEYRGYDSAGVAGPRLHAGHRNYAPGGGETVGFGEIEYVTLATCADPVMPSG